MRRLHFKIFVLIMVFSCFWMTDYSFSATSLRVSRVRSWPLIPAKEFLRPFNSAVDKILARMQRGDQWFGFIKTLELSQTEWAARANREVMDLYHVNWKNLIHLPMEKARMAFREILLTHLANFITQRLREDGLLSNDVLLESHKSLYRIQAVQLRKLVAARVGWKRVPDLEDLASAIRYEATLLVEWTNYRDSRFATVIINYATKNAYSRLQRDGILMTDFGAKKSIAKDVSQNMMASRKTGESFDCLEMIPAPDDRSDDAAILLDDAIQSEVFRIYVENEQARRRTEIRDQLPWIADDEVDVLLRLKEGELRWALAQQSQNFDLPYPQPLNMWVQLFSNLRLVLLFAAYHDVFGNNKRITLEAAGKYVSRTKEWARRYLPRADSDFVAFWTDENRYGRVPRAATMRVRVIRYFEAIENDSCRKNLAQFRR